MNGDGPSLPSTVRQRPLRRNARPLTGVAGVLAVALLLLATSRRPHPLPPPAAAASGAQTALSFATATAALPFDPATPAALHAAARKVFAHYVPWFPLSLDDQAPGSDYYARNYLRPDGEQGRHTTYGGYLRDRPLTPPRRPAQNWRLRDLRSEVLRAAAAGIDGFTVDIVELSGTGGARWRATELLVQAAHASPGFSVMLMPDMSGAVGTVTSATLARNLAHLGSSPTAYRLPDGRLVVSPFSAERHPVAWWAQFMSTMRDTYHLPVALLPLFQDERRWRDAFAPISYGMSNWGVRNPAGNATTDSAGRISSVHDLGQAWMQPVSGQDERPRSGIFDEAENTTNLRDSWQIAIDNGSELVQLATWNDYAEGTNLAPSSMNGSSFLDICAYYLTLFKLGSAPRIVRDTVYLTHRTQPWAARPTSGQTRLMTARGGSPPRDTVEALTFMTAPATVTFDVGGRRSSCAAPAGVHACTAPLHPGAVRVGVDRGGRRVTAATSPYVVTSHPVVQDLHYVAVSSGAHR